MNEWEKKTREQKKENNKHLKIWLLFPTIVKENCYSLKLKLQKYLCFGLTFSQKEHIKSITDIFMQKKRNIHEGIDFLA